MHRAGTLPPLGNIDLKEVFEAFNSTRNIVAGSLQMVLLKGIGKPVIVSEVTRSLIQHARSPSKTFLHKEPGIPFEELLDQNE